MGRTRRRNPYARELRKPQYRQRRKKDKRLAILDDLLKEEAAEDIANAASEIKLVDDDPTKIKEGPQLE